MKHFIFSGILDDKFVNTFNLKYPVVEKWAKKNGYTIVEKSKGNKKIVLFYDKSGNKPKHIGTFNVNTGKFFTGKGIKEIVGNDK